MTMTVANAVGIPVVGATAGMIPSASAIDSFAEWIDAVLPHEHVITDWLPKENKAYNQIQTFTGQSYNPDIEYALSAVTANNDETITLGTDPAALGFRVGDLVAIEDFYAGSSLTGYDDYVDPQKRETGRITAIGSTTFEMDRHNGELASGSWMVHSVGARVRVLTRTWAYGTALDDAPVWRGDSIYNVPQRIPTGLIRTDRAMRYTPTHEAKDHFAQDMLVWKERANDFRENAFIWGRRVLPTNTVAGQMGGMIWWAEQVASNVLDLSGAPLSIWHIADRIRKKRKIHKKKAGTTMICGIDTASCLDTTLMPYKQYTENSNRINIKFEGIDTRYGGVEILEVPDWPEGTILITEKADWSAGAYAGMDWQIVQQDNNITGGPVEKWGMYGDFSLRCRDVYRQILIKNVLANPNFYAGRRFFRV
jgi:hypothetical protein